MIKRQSKQREVFSISKKKKKQPQQRSAKHSKPKKTIGQKISNAFFNLIMVLLLIVGLALVFNNQIKNYLVKDATKKYTVENVSREDIVKNEQDGEATFDFEAVESLDLNLVAKASQQDFGMNVVGGIAIPSVELNLPIFKGVSNYVISVGAGTMKEDQRMGRGNYALASHYMYDPTLLFAPLVNVALGSSIFLTDLDYIYEYKVTMKEYVEPTRVEVIDDVEDKRLVTLVTCDVSGANRLIIQGELVKKAKSDDANKDMSDAFNLAQNNVY